MAELRQNTWILDEWYDQDVAGNVTYQGENQLWMTGSNDEGVLGQNQNESTLAGQSSPVQIPGTTWTKAMNNSIPSGFGMAGKSDGTLWTWGRNEYGEQGSGDVIYRSSPNQIPGTNWAQGMARTSQQGGVCMKADGTYWIWGRNVYGSLGQNQPHPTKISSPVQIPGTDWPHDDATKITGGNNGQLLAIKTDGALWGWGLNSNGALGQNNRTQQSSPVQIGTETTWSSVTAGQSVCAIKTDGTLWAWSSNDRGQLGLNQGGDGDAGDGPRLSSPAQIGTDTTWSLIATGAKQQAAIKTDGTLWTWGRNNYGDLGLNTNSNAYSSPVQVGTDTDWHSVSLSYGVMAARKTDGTMWVCGNNPGGALGQNDRTSRSSPVQIPGTWQAGFKAGNANVQLLKQK